jgi:fumarate hydratase subunit alpha
MPIDSSIIKAVTASLYERSLKKIPDDTRAVLAVAQLAIGGQWVHHMRYP